jgi:hypothetical protein
MLRAAIDYQPVPERASEPRIVHLHGVAFLKRNSVTETERVGAEKVNVNVARSPMAWIFEVMMLQIRERVGHVPLTGIDGFRPQRASVALNGYRAFEMIETGIEGAR